MIRKTKGKALQVRLGRVALSGMLAAAMGCAALPAFAHADAVQYETATFTVEAKDNAGAGYKVYRLFSAAMASNEAADGEHPASAWPAMAGQPSWNDNLKQPTLDFLDANGYAEWLATAHGVTQGADGFGFQHDLPQNALEFIGERIGASADDPDAATVPATKAQKTFALDLARAIAAAGVDYQTAEPDDGGNATFTGEEGYYLFVTDDETVSGNEAGSSPLWVPLGGATAKVVEKTAIPTLDKQVAEDSTCEFGKIADANKGQDLNYRLTATMPQNIKAFNAYYLGFRDTLPAGMELQGGDVSSVKVILNRTSEGVPLTLDITGDAQVKTTYEGNVLRVDIGDLKTVCPDVGLDATVQVLYTAHLTDDAVIGAAGNQNDAQLIYASNPVTYGYPTNPDTPVDPDNVPPGITVTPPGAHKTRTCTWEIELNKVDKSTHENLQGAKYTAQVVDAQDADGASAGKYVQADGSLADDPYEFTTNAEGMLEIPRVDSGVYLLRETVAPEGYELQDADIRLALSVELDQVTGTVSSWNAQVSGGEADVKSESDIVTHLVAQEDDAGEASVMQGRVSIQTSDDKKVDVPITGLDGTLAVTSVAGGVLLISIAGLHLSRRRREAGEE